MASHAVLVVMALKGGSTAAGPGSRAWCACGHLIDALSAGSGAQDICCASEGDAGQAVHILMDVNSKGCLKSLCMGIVWS